MLECHGLPRKDIIHQHWRTPIHLITSLVFRMGVCVFVSCVSVCLSVLVSVCLFVCVSVCLGAGTGVLMYTGQPLCQGGSCKTGNVRYGGTSKTQN